MYFFSYQYIGGTVDGSYLPACTHILETFGLDWCSFISSWTTSKCTAEEQAGQSTGITVLFSIMLLCLCALLVVHRDHLLC